MTTITPGTGGTLKSGSAEAALQEILSFIRIQEGISGRNPQEKTSVNIRMDGNSGTCTGTVAFAANRTIAGDGSISIVAVPYLQNTSFSAGTGGTFKSQSPEAAAIEIMEYLQILEAVQSVSDSTKNKVTTSFDSDRGLFNGSFTVPVALSLGDNGEAIYTAIQYLT